MIDLDNHDNLRSIKIYSIKRTNYIHMKYIPSWLKNKYLLTLIVCSVWMIFFDHNDVFTQLDRKKELREIEQSARYYTNEIEKSKKALTDLQTSPATLEKLAREKYLMKKDNEDIYVVEDSTKN